MKLIPAPTPAHKWSCPAVPVACPHQGWGCSAIVPRRELEAHLAVCAYVPLEPFLVANHARLTSIERRQALLEAENAELKAQLARMLDDPLSPIGLFMPPTDVLRDRVRRLSSVRAQPSSSRQSTSTSNLDPTVLGPLEVLTAPPLAVDRPVTPAVATTWTAEPHSMSIDQDSDAASIERSSSSLSLPRSESSLSLVPPPRPERSVNRPPSRPVSARRMSRATQPSPAPSDVSEVATPTAVNVRRSITHQEWVLDRLPAPGSLPTRETQQALRAAILHLATGLDTAQQRSAL